MLSVRLGAVFWVLVLITLFSAISSPDSNDTRHGVVTQTIFEGIQRYRSEAVFGVSVVAAIGVFFHGSRVSLLHLSGVVLCLTGLGVYNGIITGLHDGIGESSKTIVTAVITVLPLALLLSGAIHESRRFEQAIRPIVVVAVLWVLGVLVQLTVSRQALVLGMDARFRGLLGNPQHAAVYLAVSLVTCAWVGLYSQELRWRIMAVVAGSSCAVLLVWTGSRSGAIMSVIGLGAVFFARVGRLVFFAPVVAIAAWGMIALLENLGVSVSADRIVSTENTRAGAWSAMISRGMESPIVGNGPMFAGSSENSLLLALSAYGIGSLILQFFVLIAILVIVLKYVVRRGLLPQSVRPAGDLSAGVLMMYFFGAQFEGYGVARVSVMTVFLVVFASILHQVNATANFGAELDSDSDGEALEPQFE